MQWLYFDNLSHRALCVFPFLDSPSTPLSWEFSWSNLNTFKIRIPSNLILIYPIEIYKNHIKLIFRWSCWWENRATPILREKAAPSAPGWHKRPLIHAQWNQRWSIMHPPGIAFTNESELITPEPWGMSRKESGNVIIWTTESRRQGDYLSVA